MRGRLYVEDKEVVTELSTLRVDYLRDGRDALGWAILCRTPLAFLPHPDRVMVWGGPLPPWTSGIGDEVRLGEVGAALARWQGSAS